MLSNCRDGGDETDCWDVECQYWQLKCQVGAWYMYNLVCNLVNNLVNN